MPNPQDPTAREYSPSWAVLVAVGAIGGLLSGAFGVGGGIIMVPLLVSLTRMDHRRAAATSLAAIVPTTIAGSLGYLARGEADVLVAAVAALGGMAGSAIGARVLRRIRLELLRWLFLALLVAVAVRLLTAVPTRGDAAELTIGGALAVLAIGTLTGVAAGLFGIGGGVILVPVFVVLFGYSDLLAKGTSLLAMIPTAMVGTADNLRARQVQLRSGLVVGAAATTASFVGVALAFLIPPRLSSVLFATLLLAAATQLLVRILRSRPS
ncbi:sulfite exporter TauE/SafE family protein [Actinotalea sp.]|uniref:sulfite exporter TauE/SafE family protein n=1 Tax=Actinotalea sp. TaxID=1872145 RepID=UPI0035699A16